MILISNLTLNIKDGSTIASTSIYGANKKTYINIGSGNVFKLEWETPTLINGTVDHYGLVIKRHDPTSNVYYDIFNKNIGLVNEFYVDSSMLPVALEYMLAVHLVAYDKQSNAVISNVITPYISTGSGTYVKVKEDNYTEAVMKRALGLVNATQALQMAKAAPRIVLADSAGVVLADADDKLLGASPVTELLDRNGEQFIDGNGKALFVTATKVLESVNGWVVAQKGYTKDETGTWRANDITYEVLQVLNEDEQYEVLTDIDNKPIYIL